MRVSLLRDGVPVPRCKWCAGRKRHAQRLRKGHTNRLPQGQDAPGPGSKVSGILPEPEDAPIHRSPLAVLGKEALTQHHFPSHALWKEFPLSA